jgi:hypothetical protein
MPAQHASFAGLGEAALPRSARQEEGQAWAGHAGSPSNDQHQIAEPTVVHTACIASQDGRLRHPKSGHQPGCPAGQTHCSAHRCLGGQAQPCRNWPAWTRRCYGCKRPGFARCPPRSGIEALHLCSRHTSSSHGAEGMRTCSVFSCCTMESMDTGDLCRLAPQGT